MRSKTIILSNQNGNECNSNSGRGILTIYMEEDVLMCRIRLYNITKLNKFCKIGIYHNNQVYSANLLEKNGTYTSSVVGDFNIEQDFYTAIVDTSNNNNVVLSGGTYAGYFFNDQSVFDEEFSTNQFKEEISFLTTHEDEQTLKIKEDNFEKPTCEDCEKCKTCKYKEFFYSKENQNTFNKTLQENEFNSNINNITKLTNQMLSFDSKFSPNTPNSSDENDLKSQQIPFSEKDLPERVSGALSESANLRASLITQFNYVFENYQPDETLNTLITNGKFVKIEENNAKYSIGAIYEQEEMKYICYAVLCNYNCPAPEELGEHYQWLPLDSSDPLSEGYYVVFQDANDLKIVEIS